MKVYIGCFGSGLGHTSRMLEIGRALRSRGDELLFSSSGEAARLISSKGFRCNDIPLADVRYSESGEFQVKETLLDSPVILGRALRQFQKELANIRSFSPEAVLSDSVLPTVLAARATRVPVYTVLNQLTVSSSHGEQGALSRLLSFGTSAGMGRFWRFSDGVFLPDLPPPYTISEKNLWGSSLEGTRYVGFLFSTEAGTPDEASAEFAGSGKPRVFWQVSGPPRTRAEFLRAAFAVASALSPKYSFVISAGDPGGDRRPERFGWGWHYGWCANAGIYFRTCDVVVSRAGHGTIAQAITSSKPSLLVPIPKQPEQEGNAAKAEKLGVSRTLAQSALSADSVGEAIEALLSGEYSEKAHALAEFAKGFDARAAILSAIDGEPRRGRQGPR